MLNPNRNKKKRLNKQRRRSRRECKQETTHEMVRQCERTEKRRRENAPVQADFGQLNFHINHFISIRIANKCISSFNNIKLATKETEKKKNLTGK